VRSSILQFLPLYPSLGECHNLEICDKISPSQVIYWHPSPTCRGGAKRRPRHLPIPSANTELHQNTICINYEKILIHFDILLRIIYGRINDSV
ncbi:MAG: hypothetical protein Q8O88_05765, partial [bacterium]|nr:hypothetical protein [bacterium]